MEAKKLDNQSVEVGQELGHLDIQEVLSGLNFPGIHGNPISLKMPFMVPPIQRYKIMPLERQNELQEMGLSINERRGRGEKIMPEEISCCNKRTRDFIEAAGKAEETVYFASSTKRAERIESVLGTIDEKEIKQQYIRNVIHKMEEYYNFKRNEYFTLSYSLGFKSYNPQCNVPASEKDIFNFLIGGGEIDYSKEIFLLEEHLKILHIENMASFYKWLLNRNNELDKPDLQIDINTSLFPKSTLAPKVIAQVYIAKAGGKPITQNNAANLTSSFNCSKNYLLKLWDKYNNEANRLDISTSNKRSANARVKDFKDAITILHNNPEARNLCQEDLNRIENTRSKFFYTPQV